MPRKNPPLPAPAPRPALPSLKGAGREALDLFLLSAAFGILFNLFYAEGIELRALPKPVPKNKDPRVSAPVSYPGLRTSPTKGATALPAPDPFAGLPHLSLQGAKERFDAGTAVFLDARPMDEYTEAHIPRALSFYADEFDKYAPTVLPQLPDKDREIVAYCHGASCELSLHLAKRLRDLGYRNVKVFFGGWPEWKKAGYPTTEGAAP